MLLVFTCALPVHVMILVSIIKSCVTGRVRDGMQCQFPRQPSLTIRWPLGTTGSQAQNCWSKQEETQCCVKPPHCCAVGLVSLLRKECCRPFVENSVVGGCQLVRPVGWGAWAEDPYICMFTGHRHHLSMQTIATAQYVNIMPFMQHEYYTE